MIVKLGHHELKSFQGRIATARLLGSPDIIVAMRSNPHYYFSLAYRLAYTLRLRRTPSFQPQISRQTHAMICERAVKISTRVMGKITRWNRRSPNPPLFSTPQVTSDTHTRFAIGFS
jgi:hypothetical protein